MDFADIKGYLARCLDSHVRTKWGRCVTIQGRLKVSVVADDRGAAATVNHNGSPSECSWLALRAEKAEESSLDPLN